MPGRWPWVVMERAELDRLKGRVEELEGLLIEAQGDLHLQKESRFAAENRVRALEAILQVVKE